MNVKLKCDNISDQLYYNFPWYKSSYGNGLWLIGQSLMHSCIDYTNKNKISFVLFLRGSIKFSQSVYHTLPQNFWQFAHLKAQNWKEKLQQIIAE